MNNTYLMHHGTKGQKWGVRRYQNEDGSLTPEGRKRYGVNPNNVGSMSNNTKERVKKGAKIGAIAGTGVGAGVAGLTIGQVASTAAAAGLALNPIGIAAIGATAVATYAASGALRGALVGGIYGAAETKQARKYMSDKDIHSIKLSDIKDKTKKRNGNRTNLINQMNRMDEINRTNRQAMEEHNRMVNQHMQTVQLHNQLAGF